MTEPHSAGVPGVEDGRNFAVKPLLSSLNDQASNEVDNKDVTAKLLANLTPGKGNPPEGGGKQGRGEVLVACQLTCLLMHPPSTPPRGQEGHRHLL